MTSLTLPDVPEILHCVFSYLHPIHQFEDDDSQESYESRRSLAAAARTCRGFTGPALDVLWKRLPDDQPLVDVLCALGICAREGVSEALLGEGSLKTRRYALPEWNAGGYYDPENVKTYERIWKQTRGYDVRYHLSDVGDPRKHPNWPRFVEYALRVRAITLFAFDGPGWCRIWETLQPATDGAPILPRLSSVSFYRLSTGDPTPGALALISSSVRKLNFTFENDPPWIELDEKLRHMFSQSFLLAPNIDNLRLALPPSRLGLSLIGIHCSRLRRLEVATLLAFEEIRMLAEFPALEYLEFSLSRGLSAPNPLTFHSPTVLVIGGTWADLNALLDAARFPSMHTLSITGWAFGRPAAELAQGTAQCLSTISRHQTSITSLSVSESAGQHPPLRGSVRPVLYRVLDSFSGQLLDVIRPLLSLHGLRNLTLRLPGYFDVVCTSSDMRAMAESWGTLEAFHLDFFSLSLWRAGKRLGDGPNCGPLEGLVHFARNCPRLRFLHLSSVSMGTKTETETDYETPATVEWPATHEAHGLRTLIIPKVLLPAGRADLAGKVTELVREMFPLAAPAFRQERIIVKDGWALVGGASWCPECMGGPRTL